MVPASFVRRPLFISQMPGSLGKTAWMWLHITALQLVHPTQIEEKSSSTYTCTRLITTES